MPSNVTVSVVTPVYNTEEYLAECIESVLNQTYENFEYILADNRSADGTRDIAEAYSRRDSRIKLFVFDEHLPQLANYNRALKLTDPGAAYCKIVQADDILFRNCLAEMVALAETDDRIGMVGAYTLLQDRVFLDGMDFSESVVEGHEICRRYLMDGPYQFGSPTTSMFRMSEVRSRPDFYPVNSVVGDADVAMQVLSDSKFALVHQVLTFARVRDDSISAERNDFHVNALTRLILLEKYGTRFLDQATFRRARRRLRNRHLCVLGEGFLLRKSKQFWEFQEAGLAEADIRMSRFKIWLGAAIVFFRWLLNPELSLRRLGAWLATHCAFRRSGPPSPLHVDHPVRGKWTG